MFPELVFTLPEPKSIALTAKRIDPAVPMVRVAVPVSVEAAPMILIADCESKEYWVNNVTPMKTTMSAKISLFDVIMVCS